MQTKINTLFTLFLFTTPIAYADSFRDIAEIVGQLIPSSYNRPNFYSVTTFGQIIEKDSSVETLNWSLKQKMDSYFLDRYHESNEDGIGIWNEFTKENSAYLSMQDRNIRDSIFREFMTINWLNGAIKSSLNIKAGKCMHFGAISANMAAKRFPKSRVELIGFSSPHDNHAFVIVNRPKNSEISDHKTWREAKIIDVWAKQGDETGVYEVNNLPTIITVPEWTNWTVIFEYTGSQKNSYPAKVQSFLDSRWNELAAFVQEQVERVKCPANPNSVAFPHAKGA